MIITSGPERKGLTKTVREERLTLFIYIKRKKATQMEIRKKKKEGKTASEERQRRQRPLFFFAFWEGLFQQVPGIYKARCVSLVYSCPVHIINFIANTFQFKE